MARLRANFVKGIVDNAPLADSDTTLESSSLVTLPSVANDNIAVLVLDAAGADGDPEIVYVTAHADGDDEATILRGQEGTVAREHAGGTTWIHAPTALDYKDTINYFANQVDSPDWWGVDLGYDEEFDTISTSPPSGWSWVNQEDATYHQQFGGGSIYAPAVSGNDARILVRDAPAESTWAWYSGLHLTLADGTASTNGLILRDATSGKLIVFGISESSDLGVYLARYDSPTAWNASVTNKPLGGGLSGRHYFRIVKNATDDYDFYWSADGIGWILISGAYDVSAWLDTVDEIGFMAESANTSWPTIATMNWTRVRPLDFVGVNPGGSEFRTVNIEAKIDVDNPLLWGPDMGYDHEFNGAGSSLPAGVTWVNQGTSTYREEYGAGTVTVQPAGSDQDYRILAMDAPADASWEAVAKVTGHSVADSTHFRFGFGLRDSATGKFISFELYRESGIFIDKWDDTDSFNGFINSGSAGWWGMGTNRNFYWKIVKNATNDWDFLFSVDGNSWAPVNVAVDVEDFLDNPDQLITFGSHSATSYPGEFSTHWVRVRPVGGTPEPASYAMPVNNRVAMTSGDYNGTTIAATGSWAVVDPTLMSLPARAGDQLEFTAGYLADNNGGELHVDAGIVDSDGTTILRRVLNNTRGAGAGYAPISTYIPIQIIIGIVAEADDIVDGRINVALIAKTPGTRSFYTDSGELALTYTLKNFGPS
jgi:hypothetical protein